MKIHTSARGAGELNLDSIVGRVQYTAIVFVTVLIFDEAAFAVCLAVLPQRYVLSLN
jgi:hypothetical protein